MSNEIAAFHLPALERAAAELARIGGRYEAFARVGTVTEHRWREGPGWEHRSTREAGVACRIAVDGTCAFAAAAGSAASAGREAARAAFEALAPAPDPLPPFGLLGTARAAEPPPPGDDEEIADFATTLVQKLSAAPRGTALAELRLLAGSSRSILLTAEGFSARAAAGGVVLEVVARNGTTPRLFQTAAPTLASLELAALADRVLEVTSLAVRGSAPARQLADVLLSPAVAARLLAAVIPLAARPGGHLRALLTAVSPVWDVSDARLGPEGLTTLPWDGEGLPGRSIDLVSRGRMGEPLAAWPDALRWSVPPGAALRGSYREPPVAAPANLVVRPNPPTRASDLFAQLGDGFYLVLPLGEPQLEPRSGRFSLAATALGIAAGRVVTTHPGVELRGSVGRLLRNLEATGGDSTSFSLTCAVTTPSLLVRGLEIA